MEPSQTLMRQHSERFWRKVVKTESCWNWIGPGCGPPRGTLGKNYGYFRIGNRRKPFTYRCARAHRAAWILEHGEVPGGLHVLHACDNPRCVRIDHLWLGTPADNSGDMARKGRAKGAIGGAVRSRRVREEVLRLHASGLSLRDIAARRGALARNIKTHVWRYKKYLAS